MPAQVYADVSATVWQLVASVGDVLGEGETILIVESMKMEIPVVTEAGGVVRSLNVAEGDAVEEGRLLAVIDRVPDKPDPGYTDDE